MRSRRVVEVIFVVGVAFVALGVVAVTAAVRRPDPLGPLRKYHPTESVEVSRYGGRRHHKVHYVFPAGNPALDRDVASLRDPTDPSLGAGRKFRIRLASGGRAEWDPSKRELTQTDPPGAWLSRKLARFSRGLGF